MVASSRGTNPPRSALACELGNRGGVRIDYEPSDLVIDAADALWNEVAEPLAEAQNRRGLDLEDSPVRVDDRLSGIVESFADGCSWGEIDKSSSLDHGALIRLFRRTLDLLRSIATANSNLIPDHQLRLAARRALPSFSRVGIFFGGGEMEQKYQEKTYRPRGSSTERRCRTRVSRASWTT